MTNLSDREQLKEAVENIKLLYSKIAQANQNAVNTKIPNEDILKHLDCLNVLLNLAQSHLSASEDLPERKDDEPYDVGGGFMKVNKENVGFNSCLDKVTPIVAILKDENGLLAKRMIETSNENTCLKSQLSRMSKSARVENLLEKLPDMLAEAQVETIPNSAIYDVDVRKLAELIHDSIMGEEK